MKFISFNVRGLGNCLKRREILKPVKKENPNFWFLQENKLEEAESSLCRALWNLDNFDWVMQKSMGNSHGLLCILNKSCFVKQSEIKGSGFIGVSSEWDEERKKCDFNVARNVTEWKGRMGETQDIEDFNQFVESTGLIDVCLLNRKFTWYRPDGSSMSSDTLKSF
ncbi:hypothetical protein SLA2020_051930 [Shorea laevis]